MSRATLTLYQLDRPALQQVSAELEAVLRADDRPGLVRLLELGEALAARIDRRLVDLFLLPPEHPDAAPLYASLRRVCKKRALTPAFSSSHPSLEGRLRELDVLRERPAIARALDRLLDARRLPWYLRRPRATCGWLDGSERLALVAEMRAVRRSLTPEVAELLDGLEDVDGDVVAHDAL